MESLHISWKVPKQPKQLLKFSFLYDSLQQWQLGCVYYPGQHGHLSSSFLTRPDLLGRNGGAVAEICLTSSLVRLRVRRPSCLPIGWNFCHRESKYRRCRVSNQNAWVSPSIADQFNSSESRCSQFEPSVDLRQFIRFVELSHLGHVGGIFFDVRQPSRKVVWIWIL